MYIHACMHTYTQHEGCNDLSVQTFCRNGLSMQMLVVTICLCKWWHADMHTYIFTYTYVYICIHIYIYITLIYSVRPLTVAYVWFWTASSTHVGDGLRCALGCAGVDLRVQ